MDGKGGEIRRNLEKIARCEGLRVSGCVSFDVDGESESWMQRWDGE